MLSSARHTFARAASQAPTLAGLARANARQAQMPGLRPPVPGSVPSRLLSTVPANAGGKAGGRGPKQRGRTTPGRSREDRRRDDLPVKYAWVAGPKMGMFASRPDPWFRSISAKSKPEMDAIDANLDEHGMESGLQRDRREGREPRPGVILPEPGHERELTPEQLVQSSPKKGEATFQRGTNVVGLHRDPAYTIAVSGMTAGAKVAETGKPVNTLQKYHDEMVAGRLRGTTVEYIGDRTPLSMEEAYSTAAPDMQPAFDIKGEGGVGGVVRPEETGHRADMPLSRRNRRQRMLRRLGHRDMSGSTPRKPVDYDVEEVSYDHPDGRPRKIWRFNERPKKQPPRP